MKKGGTPTSAVSDLAGRIKSGKARIAVYGLGHVGSPIAAVWLRFGAHVIGVDKSPPVLASARKGRTHIQEPGVSEAFSKGLKEKRFSVYNNPVKASQDSAIKMICVPVLMTGQSLSPDLGSVSQAAASIAKGLKKGDTVVLNPSVPPGTSEEALIPVLEKESGLKVDRDFFMVYNPERIYEGRAIKDIEDHYPAIVSGAGPASLEAGSKLFSLVFGKGVIALSSLRTAEAEKLLEGVYRDVNIALANELALFCEKAGVDFWEAREAANSQPFCHIHRPGVGVGGACIPVYPQFVLHAAEMVKAECKITRLGRNVNDSMPAYCVKQALALLSGLEPSNCTVAILGLAFRGGVSDTRLSPTYAVISELKKVGAKEIRVHDPVVKSDPALPAEVTLTQDLAKAGKGADLVILATDHAEYRNLSRKELGDAPAYDGRRMLDRTKFIKFASIEIGR